VEGDLVLDGLAGADTEAAVRGLAALIRGHRDPTFEDRELLDDHNWRGVDIGGRVVGPFLLATALAHERAGRAAEALALLTRGLTESEEATVVADVLPDAARLAAALDDRAAIRTVLDHAEILARRSAGSSFQTVALHAAGLVAGDPMRLREAAQRYAATARPLPQAQALEAAAVALAEVGDAAGARAHLDQARRLYAALGSEWGLSRTAALLRQ
jgi:hypothetical protein